MAAGTMNSALAGRCQTSTAAAASKAAAGPPKPGRRQVATATSASTGAVTAQAHQRASGGATTAVVMADAGRAVAAAGSTVSWRRASAACIRRRSPQQVASAINRLLGSGCKPCSHSLPASTTSASAPAISRSARTGRHCAQPSSASGRYISATLPRLNTAAASVV